MAKICKKIAMAFIVAGAVGVAATCICVGFNITAILVILIAAGAAAVIIYILGEILRNQDYLSEKILEQQMVLKRMQEGWAEPIKIEPNAYIAEPAKKSSVSPASNESWICPKCKVENPAGHEFCVLCHTPK